jgi:hypothetical protein
MVEFIHPDVILWKGGKESGRPFNQTHEKMNAQREICRSNCPSAMFFYNFSNPWQVGFPSGGADNEIASSGTGALDSIADSLSVGEIETDLCPRYRLSIDGLPAFKPSSNLAVCF